VRQPIENKRVSSRNPKQSLPGKILWQLTHPRALYAHMRYLFGWGNEYLYSGLVDRIPAVGYAEMRLFPTRIQPDQPFFLAGLRRCGTTRTRLPAAVELEGTLDAAN
jgi:hypothetical protein